MKTAFKNFEQHSLKQGQLPMATSRLVQTMAGKKQDTICQQ